MFHHHLGDVCWFFPSIFRQNSRFLRGPKNAPNICRCSGEGAAESRRVGRRLWFGAACHHANVAAKKDVHPRKLTWNLKRMVSKRNLLFQRSIFRFHVSFRGSRHWTVFNSRKNQLSLVLYILLVFLTFLFLFADVAWTAMDKISNTTASHVLC